MIDEIILLSSEKPLILLQADHSNRSFKFENPSLVMRVKLHYQIFSAYYLPDGSPESLFILVFHQLIHL